MFSIWTIGYGRGRAFFAAVLMASFAWVGAANSQSQIEPYGEASGPVTVMEGDIISVGGRQLRLYGIDAPEMDQICQNFRGADYECGIAARNILERYLGDRTVACTIFAFSVDGMETAACQLGESDLGGLIVMYGWAVSARGISNRYESIEARAQSNHAGLWAGRFQRPHVWRAGRTGLDGAAAVN